MIQLWKETLLPGTQVDAKSKRKFTITPEDIVAGRRNINRMVKKGRNIPLVWEHQNVEENDEDDWKANYARNTFGKVGGAKISTEADVASGLAKRVGTLLVRHDVHNQKDADQVRVTGFVSPKIYRNYEDSQGEQYEGLVCAHIASTPTACQFWQQPFQLSDDDAMYLSYTPLDDSDEGFDASETDGECPAYLRDYDSWLDSIAMSATETEEGAPVADETEDTDTGDDDDTGGGMGGDVKALVKALRDKGMTISDKVTSLKELIIAVESNGDSSMPDDMPEEEPMPPENPDEGADTATTGAGGPPMMMSTLDKNPKKRARAQKEAAPEREEASKRITALFSTGRIDGPKKRALIRQATGTEMSFTQTGEAAGKNWTKFLADLSEFEKKPANSVMAPNGLGKRGPDGKELSSVATPDFANRKDVTPERAQLGHDVIVGKITAEAASKK